MSSQQRCVQVLNGALVDLFERRDDVIALGMKSILSGTLATLLMGAIVGLLHW